MLHTITCQTISIILVYYLMHIANKELNHCKIVLNTFLNFFILVTKQNKMKINTYWKTVGAQLMCLITVNLFSDIDH